MKKLIYSALFLLLSTNSFSTSCIDTPPQSKFIYGQTMDTVGDSITWVDNGDYFRCFLRDKGLAFDFVGNHLDKFNFMHDGEGGNNTQAILNRINSIPAANAYFLLAGTNDAGALPKTTVDNLMRIAGILHSKSPNAIIMVNTLLPTKNAENSRIQQINNLLIYLNQNKKLCKNCYLVNAGARFYQLPNWPEYLDSSKVHLTLEGYQVFTSLIIESLSRIPWV